MNETADALIIALALSPLWACTAWIIGIAAGLYLFGKFLDSEGGGK